MQGFVNENGLDGESIALALSVTPAGIDAAVARRLQEQVNFLPNSVPGTRCVL